MSRVTNSPASRARRKKVLKLAKGYYGRRKNTYRTARQAVDRAREYATRDRKVRKRNFRRLWIVRINAAARARDPQMTYSRFMQGLHQAGVDCDRKVLADLAMNESEAFDAVFERARQALS